MGLSGSPQHLHKVGDEAMKDSNRLHVEGDNGEGVSHTYMYILISCIY